MSGILSDLLLFSCLAAFITGIVLAVASLLGSCSRSGGGDISRMCLTLPAPHHWKPHARREWLRME